MHRSTGSGSAVPAPPARKLAPATVAVALAVACLVTVALAAAPPASAQMAPAAQQDAKHAAHDSTPAQAPAAAPTPPVQALRGAINFSIGQAEKELVSLAEAVPAEKYSWRPAEGVRSVGEVYMHVASANYFFPTFWDVKVPAGVDPRGLEKMGGDKAKVVASLKDSFAHLRHAMDGLSDADLGKPVTFFGHPATVASVVMVAVSHAHEHLGQSIAYARSNGVVPPWSVPDKPAGK